MKKLFTLLACSAIISVQAQVIYSENFNGGAPTFTLNTTDLGSSALGYNKWVINNIYTGGSFDHPCLPGFPIPVGNTATQPAGITGFPSSNYMHILNTDADANGVDNANFLSSDGNAFCVGDQHYFTRMTTPISTTGQTNVNMSFYYLCGGAAGAAYGEVYYSTDGGTSWTQQGGPLSGISSWTQTTLTNPLWDNQASLLFGFRFYNAFTGASPTDPPLCIDEFSVFVPAASTITTGTPTPAPAYCGGATFTLPYTITGSYTAGNTFTAQLSDNTGSFASPTNIGSVTTTSAGNINCTIPAGAVSGVGYSVRVVSSTPSIIGTTYGPFTVNALPVPAPTNTGPYCAGATIQLNAAAGSADYDWIGPLSYAQNNTQNPTIVSSTTGMSGVYTVTATTSANCSVTATTTVSVLDCSGIEDSYLDQIAVFPNPTTDVFTISIPEAIVHNTNITIINLVGEQVYATNASQVKTNISSQSLGLKAGIYLVQIRHDNQSKVLRLIVR